MRRSSTLTSASPSALRAASKPTELRWVSASSGVSSIRIQPLLGRDLAKQGIEECGLAGRGPAGDQNVLTTTNRLAKHGSISSGGIGACCLAAARLGLETLAPLKAPAASKVVQ